MITLTATATNLSRTLARDCPQDSDRQDVDQLVRSQPAATAGHGHHYHHHQQRHHHHRVPSRLLGLLCRLCLLDQTQVVVEASATSCNRVKLMQQRQKRRIRHDPPTRPEAACPPFLHQRRYLRLQHRRRQPQLRLPSAAFPRPRAPPRPEAPHTRHASGSTSCRGTPTCWVGRRPSGGPCGR